MAPDSIAIQPGGCCCGGASRRRRRNGTLRPPVADARLRVDGEGRVWIALRHPWADGTTHLRSEPVAMLARLAVLVPRPRVNLVLYYGVLAPRAASRPAVVVSAG